MLGSAEDNTALSRALSQLAEVEDKMEHLHQEQAANDTFSFAEVIADYIRLLGAVRVLRKSDFWMIILRSEVLISQIVQLKTKQNANNKLDLPSFGCS